jgi:hypothetical protein
MASKNELLGSGVPKVVVERPKNNVKQEYPKMIYHKELAPKIVKNEDEFEAAQEEGYDLHSAIFKK